MKIYIKKDDQSKNSALYALPDEIKFNIFKNLYGKDFFAISKTCVGFFNLTRDEKLRKICLPRYDYSKHPIIQPIYKGHTTVVQDAFSSGVKQAIAIALSPDEKVLAIGFNLRVSSRSIVGSKRSFQQACKYQFVINLYNTSTGKSISCIENVNLSHALNFVDLVFTKDNKHLIATNYSKYWGIGYSSSPKSYNMFSVYDVENLQQKNALIWRFQGFSTYLPPESLPQISLLNDHQFFIGFNGQAGNEEWMIYMGDIVTKTCEPYKSDNKDFIFIKKNKDDFFDWGSNKNYLIEVHCKIRQKKQRITIKDKETGNQINTIESDSAFSVENTDGMLDIICSKKGKIFILHNGSVDAFQFPLVRYQLQNNTQNPIPHKI